MARVKRDTSPGSARGRPPLAAGTFRPREERLVEGFEPLDHDVDVELLALPLAPRGPHALTKHRIAEQPDDRIGQHIRVARRDEDPLDPVPDDLRDAADAGRDDRPAGADRL